VRRLAVIAALVLAGCGGSHKSAATPTPTPAVKQASADCTQLQTAAAQVAQALTGATGSTSDRAKQQLDKLVGSAPSEIRADVQTIDDAYGKIVAALKSAGGGTKLEQVQQALKSVDEAKLNAANAHISQWVQQHC
jgi:outer membrane murein-binding lipoprotein Lpp